MATAIKVYNRFNKPKGKKVASGNAIYEYESYEKQDFLGRPIRGNTKIKKNKKNTQEKIQSYLGRVNYKERIKNGEEVLINGTTGELIADFTGIPNSKVDSLDFANTIVNMDQESLGKLIEQIQKANQATSETNESRNQEAQSTTESTATTSENKPADGGSNTNSVGGS
jgi:hypothetical protein